jgi:anti-sigma factor (TIGR02949 family)
VGTNCKSVVDLLQALLDGELAEADEQDLRAHLEGCPPCIEFVNTYRKTSDLCRKVLQREMPEELANRLTSFLRERIGRRS